MKVLGEIQKRFENDERLTLQDIIDDYFIANTPYQYLVAKQKATGILSQVMPKRFRKKGLAFGSIDDQGHYGIVATEAESTTYINRRYMLTKGTLTNVGFAMTYMKKNNILPSVKQEKALLPSVKNA